MHNKETEFDKYRDSYQDEITQSLTFTSQSHEFFTKRKADYLISILNNNFIDQKIKVLDVGCGHGLIHPYLLTQKNLQLSGVDIASSVIELARSNNPSVSYLSYDGLSLPYTNESFDLVYTICVMHHVPPARWNNFLDEILRVLKPNGLIVIFEHNPFNPITLNVVKKCPFDKDAVLLRSSKMKELLHTSGFKQIKSNYILFTTFEMKVFKSLDTKLHWLPLGAQYYTVGRKVLPPFQL